MKELLKNLKNKKVFLAALVLLLGVFGYILQSHLETVRRGVTGATYPGTSPESTLPDIKTGEATGLQAPASPTSETEPASGIHNAEKATDSFPAADESSTVAAGQLSNAKHGWGLKRNTSHQQPEMPASISAMLGKYGSYWIGRPDEKVVYLTFDNGYENGYTSKILDALKANEVKAAFFVTGHYLDTQPDLVKRMVDEGHIVGNHTDTHPSLPDISDEQIVKELQAVERNFEKVTGQKGMKYLRPPKGEYSERTLAVTRELGYHNIFWSLALVDWVPMPGGPQEAYRSVMDNLHNGALILLHTVSKDDAEAMDRILKDIKAQGYSFKTLDDLVKK